MDFPFSYVGLIFIGFFILGAGFIRIKDCLDQKRNLITSIIISLGILSINWVVGLSLFLGAGYFGGYIKSLYYIPFYLQFAYFIFCFLGGMYVFSKFYIFGDKFFSNYRDKGIYSFKYKGKYPF